MSRFKFGEITADVNRLGPVAEMPQLDAYTVRLSAPDKDAWIESRVVSKSKIRSSGSDFLLAALLLADLDSAARDPEPWTILKQIVTNISPEELEATVEVARRLEPYLEQAILAAHEKYELYSEHREGGIGPLEMGIARRIELPEHIGNKEEIAQFFAHLNLVDRSSFHPDDDFNDYVARNGKRAFTKKEANLRNALMVEAIQAAEAENLDIYAMSLWVAGLIDGNEELTADAPEWLKKLSEEWL